MIDIKHPEDCCGCGACGQVCPKSCISFYEDKVEGFRYPKVNLNLCIDCHLCEKVCPVINSGHRTEPKKVLATCNPDDNTRLESSSGGVFAMLAEAVLNQGGSVFGVKMDDDCKSAKHVEISDITELPYVMGSKYIQSDTGDTFKTVRKRLKEGHKVLFSGTPCQVRGLALYLGDKLVKSSNLLLVDLICHGTPSPEAWRAYLDWRARGEPVYGVNFRDKAVSGWRSFGLSLRLRPYDLQPSDGSRSALPCGAPHAGEPGVVSECHKTDLFMRSFLSNVNLRPSCYFCPSNAGRSGADITLGDFWGIPPSPGDEKGVSQILLRTEKGADAFAALNLGNLVEYPYSVVLRANPCVAHSVACPDRRARFWKYYRSNFPKAVKEAAYRTTIYMRIRMKVGGILRKLHLR